MTVMEIQTLKTVLLALIVSTALETAAPLTNMTTAASERVASHTKESPLQRAGVVVMSVQRIELQRQTAWAGAQATTSPTLGCFPRKEQVVLGQTYQP